MGNRFSVCMWLSNDHEEKQQRPQWFDVPGKLLGLVLSMANRFSVRRSLSNDHQDDGEKQQQSLQWCDLPRELLELLLSHLSGGDEAIFHCVCKQWQTIIRDPHQPVLPLPNFDKIDPSSPLLISFPTDHKNNNGGKCRLFNPINNDTYETIIPELSYATILFAKYGWLLMIQGSPQLFLFELRTKEKIVLPDPVPFLGHHMFYESMLFTSSPKSPNCLIIGILVTSCSVDVYIHKLGDSGWELYSPVDIDNDSFKCLKLECASAFYKGKYYCLEGSKNLMKFDPTDVNGTFEYILEADEDQETVFDIYPLGGIAHEIFMVENDGDLFAIFITEYTKMVYVYRWNESDRMFQLVENLGNNMLFISNGATFSQKAVVRGTGNKIYFPTFFDKKGHYAFYSLATRRYHSFSTSFSQANPYGLRNLPTGFWFSFDQCNNEESE